VCCQSPQWSAVHRPSPPAHRRRALCSVPPHGQYACSPEPELRAYARACPHTAPPLPCRRGIVYVSRIPPHMKPHKLRQLLEPFGEVGAAWSSWSPGGAARAVPPGTARTPSNQGSSSREPESQALGRCVSLEASLPEAGGRPPYRPCCRASLSFPASQPCRVRLAPLLDWARVLCGGGCGGSAGAKAARRQLGYGGARAGLGCGVL
jgi:hypothetical protein